MHDSAITVNGLPIRNIDPFNSRPTLYLQSLEWPYGAMVARLTTDQEVRCSNHLGAITFFIEINSKWHREENIFIAIFFCVLKCAFTENI